MADFFQIFVALSEYLNFKMGLRNGFEPILSGWKGQGSVF